MIRLLGAITGSALALAALLVLVGVPQFKAAPKETERAVVSLPLRTANVSEAITEQVVNAALEAVIETPVAEEATPTDLPAPAPPETTSQNPAEIAEAAPIDVLEEALQPETLQWYAFWSPFRSEIAASGFVAQLQRVTGLDFRVVKVKAGVYEVAFAYAEDEDIPINLSQISAATGLEMAGN